MRRSLLVSLLSFLAGILGMGIVLLNPMGWSWADSIHHFLADSFTGQPIEQKEGQLWTCGMHPQVIQDEPGTCPICGMNLIPVRDTTASTPHVAAPADEEREILYYRDPMDPTYTSDQPGESPTGRDLVPVYADGLGSPQAGNLVRIDPSFVQTIGVQTTTVERTDIPFTVRSVGNVSYSDDQLYWVTTKYEGWIEKVYVNYTGATVQRGERLFEIYSPQLVTTQKEYLDALNYVGRLRSTDYPEIEKRAVSLLKATRERLRYWDISEEQIQELERTRRPQRTLPVVSPVSGQVIEKMNQSLEGMFVRPGMNLYRIVDLSTVLIEADVFENQIPWLKEGQTALIEFPYSPGRQFRGTIRHVYPYLDARSRTMKVSILLSNPGFDLRKDMYADVTFDVPSARNVLAVPEEAVLFSGERNLVVTMPHEGEFLIKEVTLGMNGKGLYEVREGLREGERVVTSSQFLIDSESRLKEAIQKMASSRSGGQEPAPAEPAPVHQH
ncbi:MAG TPA: efflux RND transporter periplasmic adaptor subunit [Acidobacteriota bacterium]|nr:efflux RND transporter periplasmic adaptor subunit [Acidobacteriota bacterium]